MYPQFRRTRTEVRSSVSKADLERRVEVITAAPEIPLELRPSEMFSAAYVFAANKPFTAMEEALRSIDEELFAELREREEALRRACPELFANENDFDNPYVEAFMQRCKTKQLRARSPQPDKKKSQRPSASKKIDWDLIDRLSQSNIVVFPPSWQDCPGSTCLDIARHRSH